MMNGFFFFLLLCLPIFLSSPVDDLHIHLNFMPERESMGIKSESEGESDFQESAFGKQFENCECGIKPNQYMGNRIIGGSNAAAGSHPWYAHIVSRGCGGSVINSRWILTADHCVKGDLRGKDVVIGKTKMGLTDTTRADDFELWRKVAKAVRYDIYDAQSNASIEAYMYLLKNPYVDFGLVMVDEEIPLTKYTPLCLPPPNYNVPGKHVMVAGFGSTSLQPGVPGVLQEISNLPTISEEQCGNFNLNGMMSCSGNGISCDPGRKDPAKGKQFCFGGEEGRGACKGDSGSGLITVESGRHIVVGVVGGGGGCGSKDMYVTSYDVSTYLPWIYETVKNDGKWCRGP